MSYSSHLIINLIQWLFSIHPSIFFPLIQFRSLRGWILSQLSWGKKQAAPRTGHQCAAWLTHNDRQSFTHMFTPTANLTSPINLTCMSLECERKPDYLERTHAKTGRTSKLYTERINNLTNNKSAEKRHLFAIQICTRKQTKLGHLESSSSASANAHTDISALFWNVKERDPDVCQKSNAPFLCHGSWYFCVILLTDWDRSLKKRKKKIFLSVSSECYLWVLCLT